MTPFFEIPDGWTYTYFDKTDGTNAYLKQNPENKAIVQAGRQTAGRGRLARQWYSPEGNLYCSLCLRLDDVRLAAGYSFLTALALCQALRRLDGENEYLCKWPNDVLANGKKISGVLLELVQKEKIFYLVIGVGVNVKLFPENEEILYRTTSLKAEGCQAGVDEVAETFLRLFDFWQKRYETTGLETVLSSWTALACGLGERLTVCLADKRKEGVFSGLDKDGALLLNEGKQVVRITAGDVFFNGNDER